jgi:hypothetical protein
MLTARFHYSRAHKQSLFSKLGITHPMLVVFKIANLLLGAFGEGPGDVVKLVKYLDTPLRVVVIMGHAKRAEGRCSGKLAPCDRPGDRKKKDI